MRATKQQEEVSVESETEMYFILSKSMIISYTKYLMKKWLFETKYLIILHCVSPVIQTKDIYKNQVFLCDNLIFFTH